MPVHVNEFERLVEAACAQRWCWRLYCTTCGNGEFRKGLDLIGEGCLPEIITRETVRSISIPKDPYYIRNEALTNCCAAANLRSLSKLPMPDWLGYLGLVLHRIQNTPLLFIGNPPPISTHSFEHLRQISVSWASQFLEMIDESADVAELLTQCVSGQECLKWQHLTPIETALIARQRRIEAAKQQEIGEESES